jgi:pimeloyl-ACP methyl ester carboxylesterase
MRRRLIAFAVWMSSPALVAPAAAAQVAGERHLTTVHPSAAVRDAEHRTELRITVWYPAARGAAARPLVIGPPERPLFRVGSVAPGARFADDPPGTRRPVWILAGEVDVVAPPATNARVAARHIPGARLRTLRGAGHYVFLSTCTEAGVAAVPVCALAGEQTEPHRLAIAQAKALFGRALGRR